MAAARIEYVEFARPHLTGIIEICRQEGWPSFLKDAERTFRVLTAPGVTTMVALEDERVVGFAYVQSDGAIQAHLSLIGVLRTHRRRGIARCLLEEAMPRCGAERIDLVSTEGAEDFYRSFMHHELPGFRIYPNRNG